MAKRNAKYCKNLKYSQTINNKKGNTTNDNKYNKFNFKIQ